MPEQVIKKIQKSILPQWTVCFAWAIVMGLCAHLYKVTNWLPNWDSIVFRYDPQNMLSLGRWFLPVVCAPSSFYDLPWLAGLIAIVCHGLGAVCICKMFSVRKKITAALIGATVATFPAVTSVMMYNYVADGYAFAFLLSCLAAGLLTPEKPRFLAATVLIALSAGIYQAYITVTILLLLLHLILEVIYEETSIKSLLRKCGKFLVAGGLGMALYYLVLTVLLKVTGTTLSDYQGLEGAASLSGLDIAGSLYTIKESFILFFFDFSKGPNLLGVINLVMLGLTVILYLADVIRNKLHIGKLLLLVLFVLLMPVGASVLSLINSGIDYHNLMKMGFFVFYLFLILQYERAEGSCAKRSAAVSWAILACVALLVFKQTILANVSYHKLNMAYEKSYGTLIRIADRIEQTEGTEACGRILVVGALPDSEAYSAELPLDMTGTTDGYILRADDETVGQSVLCSALNDYCGKKYDFIAGEEKTRMLADINAEELRNWPAKDSITVRDNVIVIKLSD